MLAFFTLPPYLFDDNVRRHNDSTMQRVNPQLLNKTC